jgi:hypothetical protein
MWVALAAGLIVAISVSSAQHGARAEAAVEEVVR